jgi:glycosyltransferase involved in cell wall biosynthesis
MSEGMSLSLLEAAAARVPILVTPGANRAGFVTHGITGRVAEADPAAMAEEILSLLAGGPAVRAMAEEARKLVVSKFSLTTMARAYEEIYLDLAPAEGP